MKVYTRRKPKHHVNCKLHHLTEITTNREQTPSLRRAMALNWLVEVRGGDLGSRCCGEGPERLVQGVQMTWCEYKALRAEAAAVAVRQ